MKRFDFRINSGDVLKELQSFFHCHIQHICNRFAFIFYIQRLAVIPFAVTDFTRHINIRQKVHLDLYDAISGTGFAASALDIKTESSFGKSVHLGILRRSKQIPDHIKNSGISGRVGSGCTSDRRLVDHDHLVKIFQSVNMIISAGLNSRAVQISGQDLVKDAVDKGAFSGTGNACYTSKNAQRNMKVRSFQIVHRRPIQIEPSSVRTAAGLRDFDLFPSAQIIASDRFLTVTDIFHRSLADQFTAVNTGSRTNIHDMIGCPHGFFIVFNDDQSITQISQVFKRPKQFLIIALMKADRRFIQNV